jgi:hypothetical protein
MDVVSKKNDYLFEISFLGGPTAEHFEGLKRWANKYHILESHYSFIPFSKTNPFLSNCEATFMLFRDNVKCDFFLSLTSKKFFHVDSFLSDIESLSLLINEAYGFAIFDFCIANIETTSWFTMQMSTHIRPTELMFESSSFVSMPNDRFSPDIVQGFHRIFKGEKCTMLYNNKIPILTDTGGGT